MKAKVKQKFRDKYTGDIRFMGEIVEMSEERYNEINAKKNGLVEKVEEKTEETQTPETTKPEAGSVEAPNEFTKSTLEKMKVDELRKKAEEMGVDSMGKKEELIKRILGKEENVDEES